MNRKTAISLYAVIGALCFIIDRWTKEWALRNDTFIDDNARPFISWELVYNRGISWGFLNTDNQLQFLVVTGLVLLVTFCVMWSAWTLFWQKRCIAGHVLVIIGSWSNIIDRFLYAGVIDFIRIGYGSFVFPIFNMADVYIVLGAIIIMILSLDTPNE